MQALFIVFPGLQERRGRIVCVAVSDRPRFRSPMGLAALAAKELDGREIPLRLEGEGGTYFT